MVGGTVTRLQLPGRPLIEWPPTKPHNDDDNNEEDDEDFCDVVLLVAGEWLSRITKGVYPAPALTHDRMTGTSAKTPCVHATYRA